MSPEYRNWNVVPDNLKLEIKELVGEKKTRMLIQQGFYFLRSENKTGEIKKLISCFSNEGLITENQKKDALKENSEWNLVRGLINRSKQNNGQEHQGRMTKKRRDNNLKTKLKNSVRR